MPSSSRVALSVFITGTLLAAGRPAAAQQASFTHIGTLDGPGQELSIPLAIAPGPVVYGTNDYFRNEGNFRRALRWSPATGITPLAGTPASAKSSGAYAASADGSVLVGVLGIDPGSAGSDVQVFRRINGGPDEFLPLAPDMSTPEVTGISADGLTTIGIVNGYGGGGQAVTWIGTSTATYLPPLPGSPSARAYAVNADGSIIVGASGIGYPFDNVPVRWVNGRVESLGLPPECGWAWAHGVSADGSVVVGWGWTSSGSSRAFKWTAASGMTLLDAADPTGFAEAWSVSDDGRTIGGRAGNESSVWRDGVRLGIQRDLLPAGASITPFTALSGNALVSHDGRVLAGSDVVVERPGDTEYHAWVVALPAWPDCLSRCPADYDCSGATGVQDVFDFLSAYFAAGLRGDFNHTGGVNVQDIFDFLTAYFTGCD